MAQRTLTRMYDSYDDARAVVQELEAAGISHDRISLIANTNAHNHPAGTSSTAHVTDGDHGLDPADRNDTDAEAGGKRGAVLGGVFGGGAGLLAGIGALAIPGVGPVVAAGWLVATLAGAGVGAASGGLVGSLTGAGVSHDEAHVYAEGVKRGGSLVTVRVDEVNTDHVDAILSQREPIDWQQRRRTYGGDWKGFNEASTWRPEAGASVASNAPLPGEAAATSASGRDAARRV